MDEKTLAEVYPESYANIDEKEFCGIMTSAEA
jgi:hypothetical protein